MENDPPKDGEILPPEISGQEKENVDELNIYAQIANSISNYTNRPDLLMDAIERHDPGFIKEFESVRPAIFGADARK